MNKGIRVGLASLGLWVAASQAAAQGEAGSSTDSAPATVADQIDRLDQRLRVLARLWELSRDSATNAAKRQARLAAGREGFTLRSADGDFQLRFRGYVQADGRTYVGPDIPPAAISNLLLRRVRPITEVTAWRYFSLRVMPDFGGGQVSLLDAYLDVRLLPQLTVRAGKVKPPIGLERLQSATDLAFIERGLPTNLAPNRDVGLQLTGAFGGGVLSYSAGVWNGVPDLGNGDRDVTNDKVLVARLFTQPFLRAGGPLRGLGIGIAASTGADHGTVAAPSLAAYVTPGQQSLFRYRDSTIADGTRYRIAPQGYFYAGRLGLLAEYVVSAQDVTRGVGISNRLTHTAWQLSGTWFLTDDAAGYTASAPRRPFDPKARGWGGLAVVARWGELNPDADAFPTFANATASASKAQAGAIGLNWYLARGVQFNVNYEQTRFTGGAAAGNRATERFFVTRIQQAF